MKKGHILLFVLILSMLMLVGCSPKTVNNDLKTNEIVLECKSDWQCSEWSECSSFDKQTRTCVDLNECNSDLDKPSESQKCTIVIVEPSPIDIPGKGMEATSKFKLEEGLAIFEMKHHGSSNFIIALLDSQGNRVESLVNEIGRFDGSKAIKIDDSGEYLLDIDADSIWEIIILQPRNIEADSVPVTLSGKGHKATEPFFMDGGLIRVEMEHLGSSNFIIALLDSQGNRVESLVNEIGRFDGSKAIKIDDAGVYLLTIDADGEWEVSIE